MKFSLNDLHQWVTPGVSAEVLAEQLTMAGLEVDAILPVAGEFSNVVVGQVLHKTKHPQADRLNVCEVEVGDDAPLQIVCGAANVMANMKVAVAKVGAVLPGDFAIKPASLRGVDSCGMICSESELGLADDSSGIMALPDDAPVGEDCRDYLMLDDVIIDIDLTPNRGDCASILGVAREVAIANQCPMHAPDWGGAVDASVSDHVSVVVAEPAACPRYLARVITGINMSARTPLAMQESLRRAGIRPISVVVDVTNYVMLQLGQPLHAFDKACVDGDIHVRFAKKDETITLLDGKTVSLAPQTLLIADQKKNLAMAGIMGGEHSGVSETTQDIILESAFFMPEQIAKRARRYGIQTESSYRFERGVDPSITETAMEMATRLILDIAGGHAGPIRAACAEKQLPVPSAITLQHERIKQILGIDINQDEIATIFEQLNFTVDALAGNTWQITPPACRFDVRGEEDLLEEIARVYGYDAVEAVALPIEPGHSISSLLPAVDGYKSTLVQRGFHEAITFSFIDQKAAEQDDIASALRLLNPISQELSVMRQTLIPGLLKALKYNLARSERRVRFFEVGHCFLGPLDKLNEVPRLAAMVTGSVNSMHWQGNPEVGFYSLKGDVTALFADSYADEALEFVANKDVAYYHPGQCASLHVKGQAVGIIGAIHPSLLTSLGIKQPVFAFELNLDTIKAGLRQPKYQVLSKYPGVSRDIALVLDQDVPASHVEECIQAHAGPLLKRLSVFDVYVGEGIAKGKKSLAINLLFQSFSCTLKEEEIAAVITKVLNALTQTLNAELRE